MDRNHLERCIDAQTLSSESESPYVSLEAEIPEVLYEGMKTFIGSNPSCGALERFLVERGLADESGLGELRQAWTDAYLSTPHGQPVELTRP